MKATFAMVALLACGLFQGSNGEVDGRILRGKGDRGGRGGRGDHGGNHHDDDHERDCSTEVCGCKPGRGSTDSEKLAFRACQCDGLWNATSSVFVSQEVLCSWCDAQNAPSNGTLVNSFGKGKEDDEDHSPLKPFCDCCSM